MKGFLGLLAKAKLVDLSPDEQAALEGEQAPAAQTPQPAPEVMLPPPAAGESRIEEGKALDEIFALANIPPAAFSAEKLLRLLDGLRAMDATTRRAAVLAMDAADDNWTIADPVTDAQRKTAALEAYKQSGIRAAVEKAGGVMEVMAAMKYVDTDFPNGREI